MKDRENILWTLGAVGIYGLCLIVNLSNAWFEYSPPTVWNLLTTVSYLIFWAVFTVRAGKSPGRWRVALVVAVLTLLGGISALIVHSVQAWLLMPFAFGLTPLTGIPLYGLRMFMDWKELYARCALLGGLWLLMLNRIKA